MALVTHFTEEEKDLDRKETLEMLKGGISQAEIARQLGKSAQYICNLKKDLIAKNLITQKEIDMAKKTNANVQNPGEQIVNNKETERQQKKNSVLIGLKNKKTAIELHKELGIPITTLKRYIKELIENNEIKDSDIVKQKEKNKEVANNRNDAILADIRSKKYTNKQIAKKYSVSESVVSSIAQGKYNEMNSRTSKPRKKVFVPNPDAKLSEREKEVLSYLKGGYTYSFIGKDIGISQDELLKVINDLKILSVISSEQIRMFREEKMQNDENKVINYLKSGFKQADILAKEKDFNVAYLSRMVTKLKKENRITDEEIEQALAEDIDKIEFEKLVLSGLKKGLTVKQIIESDESGYATESRVRRMKTYLISTGAISKENFDKLHEKNQLQMKETKYDELDKQIYDLVKKGVTPLEIATCLNLTRDFVYSRQNEIFTKKKVSKEKLSEFRKKRKKLFSDTRVMAKKENDSDQDRITSRTKFFQLAREEISYGNNLEESDVYMLGRFIIINDNFLTKDNLKLVILQYINLGNYETTNKFINTLTMLYGNTEYASPLNSFNNFAKKVLLEKHNSSIDGIYL